MTDPATPDPVDLDQIKARRALAADWHESYWGSLGDIPPLDGSGRRDVPMLRCRYCGAEDLDYPEHMPLEHAPDCPVPAAIAAHKDDDDQLIREVERLRDWSEGQRASIREWRQNATTAGGKYLEAEKQLRGYKAASESAFAEVERLRVLLGDPADGASVVHFHGHPWHKHPGGQWPHIHEEGELNDRVWSGRKLF